MGYDIIDTQLGDYYEENITLDEVRAILTKELLGGK